MTREQYDTAAFRRHCRSLLAGTVDQLESHLRSGHSVEGIVGVDGSPSCGVFFSCTGYEGGEIASGDFVERSRNALRRCSGEGVFMEELRALLSERGMSLPFSAVDEESPEGTTWREVRRKFRRDADGISGEA
jgi:predicted secreted protein